MDRKITIMRQTTIQRPFTFEGVGIHSGKDCTIQVDPAPKNTGILINGSPAKIDSAQYSKYSTTVCGMQTAEHLLGFLYLSGIDNVSITQLKGHECPILDGAAKQFSDHLKLSVINDSLVQELLPSGFIPKELDISIFSNNDRKISLRLLDHESSKRNEQVLKYTYAPNPFSEDFIEEDFQLDVLVNNQEFLLDVFQTKTFCFDYQVETLWKKGLIKGGNVNNAYVIDTSSKDYLQLERAHIFRHKLLDFFGDFSLIGIPYEYLLSEYPVIQFDLLNPGHEVNLEFVQELSYEMISHKKEMNKS